MEIGASENKIILLTPLLTLFLLRFLQAQIAKGKSHSSAVRTLAFKWPRKLSGLARSCSL